MSNVVTTKSRLRKYFGKIREVAEMPNLIEVQKSSYDLFLKSGEGPEPVKGEGIRERLSRFSRSRTLTKQRS